MNALDRAILAMRNGPAAQPELYRRLSEGELWALMPWHPEVENVEIELKEGMPFPFVVQADKDGKFVPVYSSEERAEEALAHAKVPGRTYMLAAMEAKSLLMILAQMGLRMVVNFNSGVTGKAAVPVELVRDLADGSALKPLNLRERRPRVQKRLEMVLPVDYPASMVAPLAEVLRRHREFRLAWLFRMPGEGLPEGAWHYRLLVLMDPRVNTIYHDLEIVMSAVPKNGSTIMGGFLEKKNPALIDRFFRMAAPFYMAPDYERPPGAKE